MQSLTHCRRGSPPQVRGKRMLGIGNAKNGGITPAGAGKTRQPQVPKSGGWDHPRRCGENCIVQRNLSEGQGSPPQVRGKLPPRCAPPARRGITPAGAGKTYSNPNRASSGQDHPRRCGENAAYKTPKLHASGSPPQVRGKHRTAIPNASRIGITPAGAGKTAVGKRQCVNNRDHPRRCGENGVAAACTARYQGSPPQVRGKPEEYGLITIDEWITPAGAGKTFECRTTKLIRQDHPRRCGENISSLTLMPNGMRITPAGAGKTDAVYGKYLYVEDHPRRCGENTIIELLPSEIRGSPPQVRGKLEYITEV